MVRGESVVGVRLEKSNNHETNSTGEATRKCVGQLSSGKTNSCSSYKSVVNRTTEMAQEDDSPCWDNLPSVILLEIFSYLPHENRIRASQVCRNWRYALFHPSFWKKITFALKDEDNLSRARFLANCFGLSVREATIRCDMASHCLKEGSYLLKKLSGSTYLRKLIFEPSGGGFEWSGSRANNEDEGRLFCISIMESLLKIVETTNCLEALSLGCVEDLTLSAGNILEPLQHHHAKHLRHLSLASVKDDPDDYVILELDNCIFRSFVRLSILTLDYDYISDALLYALDNGSMERLVIHVHGLEDDHPGTANSAWQAFVEKNPRCELRLNLVHSYVAVTVLDTVILQPAMPLSHLKVLFCETVNVGALHLLSSWYLTTLKSITWIDSVDSSQYLPATYDPDEPDSPDPLVLLAWKCTKLVEVVFLGYKYYQENLLAIARLRGSTLKRLEFAESDICNDNESNGLWYESDAIKNEIRKIMGGCWQPLSDAELPAVIMDPHAGDSREVIMPMVLRDQK